MVIKGINPVIEALEAGADVEKIILPGKRHDHRIERIKVLARKASIPFLFSPAERIPVAYIAPVKLCEEEETLQKPLIICLDRVEDPMNLGAIIRSAVAFDVPLVLEKRHSPPLNETVAGASAGTIFKAKIHRTTNLPSFLKRTKMNGYWVVCADKKGESLAEFSFPERSIIVLGSEGRGLRKSVKSLCDFAVTIPMKGKIDSLNVSVAAAIFLYTASLKL